MKARPYGAEETAVHNPADEALSLWSNNHAMRRVLAAAERAAESRLRGPSDWRQDVAAFCIPKSVGGRRSFLITEVFLEAREMPCSPDVSLRATHQESQTVACGFPGFSLKFSAPREVRPAPAASVSRPGHESPALAAAFPARTPAEKRHNFAIWTLKNDPSSRQRLYLYYCMRCNWAFLVDHNGAATPLTPDGRRLEGAQAAERIATFPSGPCASFTRVLPLHRMTQKISPVRSVAGLFLLFLTTAHQFCHAFLRGWRH
jgi:hypothetical protein